MVGKDPYCEELCTLFVLLARLTGSAVFTDKIVSKAYERARNTTAADRMYVPKAEVAHDLY